MPRSSVSGVAGVEVWILRTGGTPPMSSHMRFSQVLASDKRVLCSCTRSKLSSSLAVLLLRDVNHPSKATKLKINYCRLFCRPAGVSRKRSHAQRCKVHITTSVQNLADEVRSFLVCAPHVVAQAL